MTKTVKKINFFSIVNGCCERLRCENSLATWTQKPAVYQPQGLAVKNERIRPNSPACALQQFNEPVTDFGFELQPVNVNAGSYFSSGQSLSFSAANLGPLVIGPTTGLITNPTESTGNFTNIVVNALNNCGSTP